MDRNDVLAGFRARFRLPDDENVVYLDGNSLGPLPASVPMRMREAVEVEWGRSLVRGWNDAGWIDLPARAAGKIARLIGAPADSVAVCDSTSVNLFKVLAAALSLRPERKVVITDVANFPTDLYVADGLARLLDRGYEIKPVQFDQIEAAIDDTVAAFMLTEVDYRTGRMHDMGAMTAHAHACGALAIWDLAHSAGAFPVDLTGARADFAIGCGYKYLNGGPGAPAFLFVAEKHLPEIAPAIAGWMGHLEPFAFSPGFVPADGIARMTSGTPPILSLVAFDAALDAFDGVDLASLRVKSQQLCDYFIAAVEANCEGLELATPRDAGVRGSQVSFRHPEGYAIVQALIARGVIGDFRAPDIMRFGFAPLYLRFADIHHAAEQIGDVIKTGSWDEPRFKQKAKVT
ncbi:kynureninase [Mesorhizobium sp. INR15]|uniref:kynureninase n=1 Tax=Mesorhizobium sp. INR15 TaxID=2654248 RepID=UPI0021565CB9|nr:kynureninase [Mesorhizobium sp. INR15]